MLNVTLIFKPGLSLSDASQPIHLVKGRPVKSNAEIFRLAGLIAVRLGGFIGTVVLFIDALRRQYDEPKAMPLVLAGMGIVCMGITSVIYYLEWGNDPTKPPAAIAEDFCQECVAHTRPERVMQMSASHRILTVRLIGSMRRCPNCGSIIKTLWLWCLIPMLPFCSYRVLPNHQAAIGSARVRVRRLPWMDWTQVGIRYFILALIAGGVLLIAYV